MSKNCGCPCTCETKNDALEGGVVSTSPTEKQKRKRVKKVKVEETLPPVELPTEKTKKVRKTKKVNTETVVEPSLEQPKEKVKREPSAWVKHVQAYRVANPTVSYKEAMTKARETYSKA